MIHHPRSIEIGPVARRLGGDGSKPTSSHKHWRRALNRNASKAAPDSPLHERLAPQKKQRRKAAWTRVSSPSAAPPPSHKRGDRAPLCLATTLCRGKTPLLLSWVWFRQGCESIDQSGGRKDMEERRGRLMMLVWRREAARSGARAVVGGGGAMSVAMRCCWWAI